LKLAINEEVEQSSFDMDYRDFNGCYSCGWPDYDYEDSETGFGESPVVHQLKESARMFGVEKDEVDLLLDFGYDVEEIELMLNYPNNLHRTIQEVAFEAYGC